MGSVGIRCVYQRGCVEVTIVMADELRYRSACGFRFHAGRCGLSHLLDANRVCGRVKLYADIGGPSDLSCREGLPNSPAVSARLIFCLEKHAPRALRTAGQRKIGEPREKLNCKRRRSRKCFSNPGAFPLIFVVPKFSTSSEHAFRGKRSKEPRVSVNREDPRGKSTRSWMNSKKQNPLRSDKCQKNSLSR